MRVVLTVLVLTDQEPYKPADPGDYWPWTATCDFCGRSPFGDSTGVLGSATEGTYWRIEPGGEIVCEKCRIEDIE